MLYLVNCELKGGYPVPAEEWLGLVLKGMEEVQQYRAEGKVVFHGALVGRQAGIMIWDVESNAELQKLLTQLPFWPFMKWKITPLISTDETVASLQQALAAAQGSR